jgi:hypothetical protein
MLAGGTQKWGALPVKLKDAKDWIFGPAIASRDVLADCLERQWMTHRIIDIELGMEANDEALHTSIHLSTISTPSLSCSASVARMAISPRSLEGRE